MPQTFIFRATKPISNATNFDRWADRSRNALQTFHSDCYHPARSTDSKRLAPRGAPTFPEESARSRLLFSSISSEEPCRIPHGRATRPFPPSPPATPQRATARSSRATDSPGDQFTRGRNLRNRDHRLDATRRGKKGKRKSRKLDPPTWSSCVARGRRGGAIDKKKKHVRDHDYLRKGSRSTSIDVVTYL